MSASHDQLAPLASAYALGALDPDERRSFERHAAECDICTAEVHAFSNVVAARSTSVTPVAFRDRPSRITSRKSRILNRRSEMIWLPYAALLAVTVGLGGYSLSLRARVADLEVRLADATSRTLLATRAMADAQRVALQTQSSVDVLTAPDLARIDL